MASFNLRLQDEQDDKITIIAEQQSRSKNKQIEFILEQFIKDYEKVNGTVKKK